MLNAAQLRTSGRAGEEVCDTEALGNAVSYYDKRRRRFCINLSYYGLSGSETDSYIRGPAYVGEHHGRNLYKLPNGHIKNACFHIDRDEERDLYKGLWYFQIHSSKCDDGELRGQILPHYY